MNEAENNTSSTANIIALLWLSSLVLVGVVGYLFGQSSVDSEGLVAGITTVPTASQQITPPPNTTIAPTRIPDLGGICEKSGPSQKKDYLIAYILKEGDSFNSVAENELKDPTRVSELTKLNEDQKNLTVGSTIYLPPSYIKSSNGALLELSGKIIKKDNASWQISFGGGSEGRGVDMPAYYFKDIPNLQNFQIGDCVTVFLEDGVKVHSISKN